MLPIKTKSIREFRAPLRSEHILDDYVWWRAIHQFFGEFGRHQMGWMVNIGWHLNGKLAARERSRPRPQWAR